MGQVFSISHAALLSSASSGGYGLEVKRGPFVNPEAGFLQ